MTLSECFAELQIHGIQATSHQEAKSLSLEVSYR